MVGFEGVTVTELMVALLTLKDSDPITESKVAVTLTVPWTNPFAVLPDKKLSIVGSDDAQVT